MTKLKYDEEFKRTVIQDYLSGTQGFKALAPRYGVDYATIRCWVESYRDNPGRTSVVSEWERRYHECPSTAFLVPISETASQRFLWNPFSFFNSGCTFGTVSAKFARGKTAKLVYNARLVRLMVRFFRSAMSVFRVNDCLSTTIACSL